MESTRLVYMQPKRKRACIWKFKNLHMADKYAKLVMVTPDNNNKYYEMTYTGGSTFSLNMRIESSL